jgi:hypothetical protein
VTTTTMVQQVRPKITVSVPALTFTLQAYGRFGVATSRRGGETTLDSALGRETVCALGYVPRL